MDKEILGLIDTIEDLIPKVTKKLENEDLICECFCVSAGDIRGLCSGQLNLDLIQKELNLGQGCQGCLNRKDDWIDRI
jgi:NAD(P)H-nitrite reductase large subunit